MASGKCTQALHHFSPSKAILEVNRNVSISQPPKPFDDGCTVQAPLTGYISTQSQATTMQLVTENKNKNNNIIIIYDNYIRLVEVWK